MTTRRFGLTVFLVVVAALAAYGIQSTPEPRAVAGVGRAEAFSCTLDTLPGPLRPPAGTVPDTFTPIMAVVCDVWLGSSVGADMTATFYEHHYVGDFGPVVEELNAPSARRSVLSAACGDYSLAIPNDMWLVDADGHAMEPSYPLNGCGLDNTLGLFDTLSLTETGSVEHRIQLDAADVAQRYYCSPIMTAPTPGPLPLIELPQYPSGFCRFDTSGPYPVFVGAETFDNANPQVAERLFDPPEAGPCTERATSVATTTSTGSGANDWTTVEVVVELDGCRRILADGYLPLAAPQVLLTALGSEAG